MFQYDCMCKRPTVWVGVELPFRLKVDFLVNMRGLGQTVQNNKSQKSYKDLKKFSFSEKQICTGE